MRKLIGLSQRVTVVAEYQERRDAVDQRWAELLNHCELIPIVLPNHPASVANLLKSLPFDGFVLTGGNDLEHLGGNAPERDQTERLVLEYAIASHKPLLGVCRGMQFIQHHFQVPLERVTGHVGQMHRIAGRVSDRVVNSYHQFGARSSHPDLNVTAVAEDGVVESIQHRSLPIHGIMWHPERCAPFQPADCQLLSEVFANYHPQAVG